MPEGDLLLHAGDFTVTGTVPEIERFGEWLNRQPFKHKVVIPGNHDLGFEDSWPAASAILRKKCPDVQILNQELVDVEGKLIWGSPWTPEFHGWAFNYDHSKAPEYWKDIPERLDVLMTHGPPHGVLDGVFRHGGPKLNVGCPALLLAVQTKAPRFHVFGHIHECGGRIFLADGEIGPPTTFINAANVDLRHHIVNSPIVFEI
jgi:Icc-related predicted phosphoesterase